MAIGGWRLVKIAGWRLAVGGWRRLAAVGGSWQLVMGGWWRLAAVDGWRLVAVGGWRLAVGGGWRLVAVGGPLGRSLRAVLNKKKIWSLKERPGKKNVLQDPDPNPYKSTRKEGPPPPPTKGVPRFGSWKRQEPAYVPHGRSRAHALLSNRDGVAEVR